MRQRRIAIVMLLTAGVLGVFYWVATGQEGRAPWPPPPVKFNSATAGSAAVPPPVPSSGTMPPVPADKKTNAVRTWVSNLLPGSTPDAPKPRVCGVGEPDGVQQTSFQERASDIPPPVPAKPTIGASMPPAPEPESKPIPPPVPVMPDVPGGRSPALPVIKPASSEPPSAQAGTAMPIADAPRIDPSKSVITDPVQQLPGAAKKDTTPPSFVLVRPRKDKSAVPGPPVTPATPHVEPLTPPHPTLPPAQQTVARTVTTPEIPRLADVQTPPVMVEKRSTASRPGEPRAFQLVVRNLGTVIAPQVAVEDDLPADARVVHADPMPQVRGARATWLLHDLAPGGARVLSLTLQGGPADWPHNPRVHVSAASRAGTPLEPVRPMQAPTQVPTQVPTQAPVQPATPSPGVTVQVTAPPSAMTGRPAVFEVTFANTGKVRVTGLLLHAILSAGLQHPVGQSIEADVGDLDPGVSKTVKVTVTAVQPGRQSMQVHMKSPSGAEAAAQAAVEVAAAPTGLGVQQAPMTRLFTGRTADLRIEITNHTAQPMRQVNIASYLPEGVDFVAATDYGNYQPNGRTVNWLLDPLAPGQTQAVLLRVTGTTPGQHPHTVVARAVGVPEVKSTSNLSVEGVADLLVDLHGDNAVELGRETVYEVRVANPGSGPSTNVRVVLELTPGLVPRNAQGPAAFRIDGQRVIFEPLTPLVSQGSTLYRVLAAGQTVGEARVRASVTSDQVPTPVTREGMTRVYRD